MSKKKTQKKVVQKDGAINSEEKAVERINSFNKEGMHMISPHWDLSFLYTDFDDPALARDIARLEALAKEGPALTTLDAPDIQRLEAVINAAAEA